MKQVARCSRDNARTPMQWNSSDNAGFKTGTPWIEVNPNYRTVNVETDSESEKSIQEYYRKLAELRRNSKVLLYGSFELIFPEDPQLFAYTRTLNDSSFLILLHFSEDERKFPELKEYTLEGKECLISNYGHGCFRVDNNILRPYEARVYA